MFYSNLYEIFIEDVAKHLPYPTDEATASEVYVPPRAINRRNAKCEMRK